MNFFNKILKEEEKTHYYIKVKCTNCKKFYEIAIPLKVKVKDHLKNEECVVCGLNMLTYDYDHFEDIFAKFKEEDYSLE